MDFVIRDRQCNVQSGLKNVNCHYGVLVLEHLAQEVAFYKRKRKPGAYSHRFCSAIRPCRWYKMLLRGREEYNSVCDDGEGRATKECEWKIRTALVVKCVSLHYG